MRQPLFLILLFASLSGLAQDIAVTVVERSPLKADMFIGVDKYDNTYSITDRTLYKTGVQGKYQFAALNLGEITSVDMFNPLKVTLFYKNANTAVILDNTLTEINRINFSAIESFRNVSHATTAGDRRLWIYNTDLQQLEIFDYNQDKIITQFAPMTSLATNQVSNFNFCWVTTTQGISIYNIYGSLITTLPMDKSFEKLQANNSNLIGLQDDTLFYKGYDSNDFRTLKIPEITIKQFSFKDEILYIYDGQNLMTTRLKPSKK